MKLADALKAIDDELLDLLKDEIHNVTNAVETDQDRRSQLAKGIDRLLVVERIAIEIATQKIPE